MPKAIKVKGIDFILFVTKEFGVVVDYACVKNDNKYELYEMKLKTYNEYEKYMTEQ